MQKLKMLGKNNESIPLPRSMRSSNGKNSGDEITRAGVRQSGESFLAVAYLQSNRNQMHPKPFLKRILTQWWPVNSLPWLAAQGAKFNMFFGQFFGAES